MARPIPFNRIGIYGIETTGAPIVSTTDVTLTFEDHPNISYPYNGLLIVKVSQAIPTGTTGTLPVIFRTGNNNPVAATKTGGAPLTAADMTGTGYYLFFYDFRSRTLQAISSIV